MNLSSSSLDLLLRPIRLAPMAIRIVAGARGIQSLELLRKPPVIRPGRPLPRAVSPHLAHAARELTLYFEGRLRRFTVPVDLSGQGTDFQRRVWRVLQGIPYGSVVSYACVASRVGMPRGARAVGGAVGRNPLPVIIPCHRVVGSEGRLTGFSSGLDLKVLLLELEGVLLSPQVRTSDREVVGTA